jgi:hypothetical protein
MPTPKNPSNRMANEGRLLIARWAIGAPMSRPRIEKGSSNARRTPRPDGPTPKTSS